MIISPCFAIFKNIVHSLEPGETLSRIQSMCNVLNYRKTFLKDSVGLQFGSSYFFNLLKFSTVFMHLLRAKAVCLCYYALRIWLITLSKLLAMYILYKYSNVSLIRQL